MDLIDKKILDLLQHDCTLSIAEIGNRVGLSQTPCWKRIQKLEAGGYIQRRVALLDRSHALPYPLSSISSRRAW